MRAVTAALSQDALGSRDHESSTGATRQVMMGKVCDHRGNDCLECSLVLFLALTRSGFSVCLEILHLCHHVANDGPCALGGRLPVWIEPRVSRPLGHDPERVSAFALCDVSCLIQHRE